MKKILFYVKKIMLFFCTTSPMKLTELLLKYRWENWWKIEKIKIIMNAFGFGMLIITLYIFLHGCAATNKGSYQEIEINSNVIGASVELDGAEIGRTPFKGKINRDKIQKIIVKTDYAFNEIKLEKRGGMIFGADAQGLGVSTRGTEGAAVVFIGFTAVAGTTVVGVGATVGAAGGGKACVSPICVVVGAVGIAFIAYLYYELYKSKSASDIAADLASTASETTIKSILGAAWEYSPSQYYAEFKEEGSSDWDFINDVAIRSFAMVNHSQIAIDAGNEDGEYVDALSDLMETKKDREIAKQDINEALEESKGDQVAFGDALVERFHR